jgi:hypothetical protein
MSENTASWNQNYMFVLLCIAIRKFKKIMPKWEVVSAGLFVLFVSEMT